MRGISLAICLSLIGTGAFASDRADVIATIRQYVGDFNNNDINAEVSRCTTPATIVDDFPPHTWRGCREWLDAFTAGNAAYGDSEYKATLGKAWNITVSGDAAYVVYPTRIDYKHRGRPAVDHGVWTFVLQKLPVGWRISAWAWAAH